MQSALPEKKFHYKDPLLKGELADFLRQIYGPENVRKYKYDYRSPVFQKRRERFYCVTAILGLGEALFTDADKKEAAELKAKEKTQTDDPAAATVEVLEKYRSRFLLASHREIHSASWSGECDGEGMFYLLQSFFRDKTNSSRPAADAFLACNFLAEQGINVDYTDPQDTFNIEQGKITFQKQGQTTCIGYILGKTPPPIIIPPSARRSSTPPTSAVSENISKRGADTPRKTANRENKNPSSSSSATQDKRDNGNYSPARNHTPAPPKTPPHDFTPAPSYTPAPDYTPNQKTPRIIPPAAQPNIEPKKTQLPRKPQSASAPESTASDSGLEQLEQSFDNLSRWFQNTKTTLSDSGKQIGKRLNSILNEAQKLATNVTSNSRQVWNEKGDALSNKIADLIADAQKALKGLNAKADQTAKRSLQSLITMLAETRRYLANPPTNSTRPSSQPTANMPTTRPSATTKPTKIPAKKKQRLAPPQLIPVPKKPKPKPDPLKKEQPEGPQNKHSQLWQTVQQRYSLQITKDLEQEDGPFCFEGSAKVAGETIELLIYGNTDNPGQKLNKLNNKLALLSLLIPVWRRLFGKLNLKARLTESDLDRVFLRAEKLGDYTLIYDFSVPANLTFDPAQPQAIEKKSAIKLSVDRGRKQYFKLFHDDRLARILHQMKDTEKALAALRLFDDFYLFITKEAVEYVRKSKSDADFSSHWDYETRQIQFIDNTGKVLFKITNGQPFFQHFILNGDYPNLAIRTLFQTELQKAAAPYLKKIR